MDCTVKTAKRLKLNAIIIIAPVSLLCVCGEELLFFGFFYFPSTLFERRDPDQLLNSGTFVSPSEDALVLSSSKR